jgi:hypothetical protein
MVQHSYKLTTCVIEVSGQASIGISESDLTKHFGRYAKPDEPGKKQTVKRLQFS